MKTADFDFSLPSELIAQFPTKKRDASRLLVVNRKTRKREHRKFSDFPDCFGKNDVLVFNRSLVLPARIRLDEKHEIFLSKPRSKNIWECLVRGGKKFSLNARISFADGSSAVVSTILPNGLRLITFFPIDTFTSFLEKYGSIPLPPYIHRKSNTKDKERYQTVFADQKGSVAAPTAGLHFTKSIFTKLRQKGIQMEFVTLHVGLGTFLPVKSKKISEHEMHAESFEITPEVATRINEAKRAGKKITAIGSTALRSLESATNEKGVLDAQKGGTNIFLYPPAPFRIVDHFLTNFHTPKSTLLMLLAAFASPEKIEGREWVLKIYAEAVRERYRFFSYGDASLWL